MTPVSSLTRHDDGCRNLRGNTRGGQLRQAGYALKLPFDLITGPCRRTEEEPDETLVTQKAKCHTPKVILPLE